MLNQGNQLNYAVQPPPKRVLFVITQSEMGGAQRFLYNFVSHLDRNKYALLVAVGSDGGGELIRNLKDNNFSIHELKFLKRAIGFFSDLRAVFELRHLINEFNPQSIFLSSSKAGFLGSLATRLCRGRKHIKVIYRIGGWSFNDPRPKWEKKLWIWIEKLSARWKDIIILNNKHDFDQAKQLKIKPRKELILIYNGLDVYKMDFLPREDARLKLFEKIIKHSGKIFQIDKIIGTIANFYPPKGLEYLVEAAEHFKNDDTVAFIIIGEGEERGMLENLIKIKGLEKKVFLIGQVPEAHKLLSAFDIFVLPSLKEGFPWSLIEAMSAKLPVIATSVGAVPEIIEDYKNGIIIRPADATQIAAKIKEVLGSDRLKQEMGIQAHQTVLFKFNADKMISQTEALL